MRIEDLLRRSGRDYRGKTAVVCGGGRYSYEWLNREAARCANDLLRSGIRPGSRVGICLDNSVDAIVWMFAVAVARSTFFHVNSQSRPDRLRLLEEDAGAAAMIVRDGVGRIHIRTARKLAGSDLSDQDLAALVYTSGSTGMPKGVMLSHSNLCAAATSITTYLANTPDDVIFSALPVSFTYGLGQVITTVMAGATLVLAHSFAYPRAVLDTLAEEEVTGLPVVPTMVTLLLQQDLAKHRLPSLRYITNAAAALTEDKMRRLRTALPHVAIYSMYGQTECQRATFLPPELLDTHPSSVGRAIPGATTAVVDERGNDVAPGVVGAVA